MRIRNIAAYRRQLQAQFDMNPEWKPDFMGSCAMVDGKQVSGFFKFWQSSTGAGREPIAGKLRGVLEMAQNDQAIYEITQNAADCGATQLSLWYDEAHFLACNDGEAFTDRDVQSILDTFGSQKALRSDAGEVETIGQYGVGFKLFHRLVGKESGLEELLDHGAGPMIFSWSNREQLDRFLAPADGPIEPASPDTEAPWLFKILLTCFPAAPGEVVRDINFCEVVAFTTEEAETFRQWAAAKLGAHRPEQGSLFFLHLGEGKRNVLDAHMTEIRSCMAVSLCFLRKLASITVNGERIERVPLETITLSIPKEELRALGFREEHRDVELVFAYGEEAVDQLVKEPTLYQYFPMTKEAHGMGYVIHSNGLQKQAQRTELNADSPINARLFDRLVAHIKEEAQGWMEEDPDRYRSLFKAILHSRFDAARLKVLHEHVQQPLINFIREHVPTMDGSFEPREQVTIRRSKLDIPRDVLGDDGYWFFWTKDLDERILPLAKNSSRLNLPETDLGRLLKETPDQDALCTWMEGLSGEEYAELLKEVKVLEVDMEKVPEAPLLRLFGALRSLSDLVKDPDLLEDLDTWYGSDPSAQEWLPRETLEKALVAKAGDQWAEVWPLLHALKSKEPRNALIQKLDVIHLDLENEMGTEHFLVWWMFRMDDLPNTEVRKKLVVKSGDQQYAWDDALVLEQIKLTTPAGATVQLALDKILPGTIAPGQQEVLALEESLAKKGYRPDFLEMAFKRKQRSGKEELVGIGDLMVKELEGKPLSNGTQLLFAVLLKDQDKDWKGFDGVKVQARDGEDYDLGSWWYYQAPVFMSDHYLLDQRYADLTVLLGAEWSTIKVGDCSLVHRPRLSGGFIGDGIKEELDETAQVAFANWLLKESQANSDALDLIGTKYRDSLKKVLQGDPGDWVRADDAWTIPEERIPAWVLTWIGEDEERKELFGQLGLHGPEDPVIAWREALFKGGEDVADGLKRARNTREWVVAKGGSQMFTTHEQEVRITELVRELGEEPVPRARPELEEHAKECADPIYGEWRNAGGEWQVFEFEGAELPVDLCAGEDALARAHGMKVIPARDGSKRLFVLAGTDFVDLLVQLYGKMDEAAWRSLREVYSKHLDRSKPKKKETDNRGASLKEQVQELKERQLAYAGNGEMSLAELLNALEWEYQSKLLARQEGKTIRFKEVRETENGMIHLAIPSVDELPYELNMGGDPKLLGITLKLRNKGGAYHEVHRFELLGSSEGEVLVKIPEPPLTLKRSTVAMIEMEPEDFLLSTLVNAWEEQAGPLDGDKSVVGHIRERAPGEQVGFIFGPPGTGKTTELAGRLIATVRNSRSKVLVLTPTNNAADVLYTRISEKAKGDLNVLRAVHRFGSNSKQVLWEDDLPVVVITTMHRFPFDAIANGPALNEVDWDQVVFDEASMAALPHALLPLFTLPPRTGEQDWGPLGARFLFAGDPFQLPPVGLTPSLLDRIEADKAKKPIRGYSIENIYTVAGIDRFDLEEAPNLEGAWIHRLTTNYRSGRSIVELFSRSRYQSGVTSAKGNDEHAIRLGGEQLSAVNLLTFPAYVPTDEEKRSEHLPASAIIESGASSVHVLSAVMAVRLALMLATQNAGKRVIIVCPYNKQVRLCESLLEPFNERHPKEGEPGEVRMVEVASVHRYQGGEAEVVIFLLNPSASKGNQEGQMVIGRVALFNDPHLINVGISRAKDVVIVLAPEDKMARTDYLGYHLMDDVLTREVTDGLDVAWKTCEELEPKLFGRAGLTDRIAVLPLRNMDVLRTQDSQQAGNDLVVMHSKSNLNLIVLRDLLMEGI